MIEKCYEEAKTVIKKNIFTNGIFASPGYHSLWSRDSMISFLGASLIKEKLFREAFRNSLTTLAKNQSKLGQIPNAVVGKYRKRKPRVDYASIDSSLWFIIGEYLYKRRYNSSLKHETQIKKALTWLTYQDLGENGMLVQQPTTDWQDAFPHKYGYTINTQALYYAVLNLVGEKEKAKKLKKAVNQFGDIGLWKSPFYIPWRWKNHNKYREIGEWFDSLGNLLAIIFDLADKSRAKKILSYIEEKKINAPYPVKAIYPPIKKGTKDWEDYFKDCDAKNPYHYLNAGIWTYIGGFYILALLKHNMYKKAEIELSKLAKANLKGNFPEWIHPFTKKTYGKNQAWDAGMYIIAYKSFKEKKCLI